MGRFRYKPKVPNLGATMVELQARPCWSFYQLKKSRIYPQLEGLVTTEGEGLIYAGICLDWFLSRSVVVTPSFSPGGYFKGNPPTKGLWCPLEFKSAIEIAAVGPSRERAGFSFFHISNAGLGSHNPGANGLTAFYAFPF